MEQIRVMLIDEQPLFRVGVRWAFAQSTRCVLISESSSSAQGLTQFHALLPDVVIIDLHLAHSNSLELAMKIRRLSPTVALIMLTDQENEEQLFQCLKIGAAAYLLKNIESAALVQAINDVHCGQYLIMESLLMERHALIRSMVHFWQPEIIDEDKTVALVESPLSGRELEILGCIAHGNTNKAIGTSLNISDQTVKNHITSILRKLQVHDRTAAVVYGLRQHWLTLQSA